MDNHFFERPILNSPYDYPAQYWELDEHGQPTQRIIESRRRAEFITPIPKPRKRTAKASQVELVFDEGKGLSTEKQQYDPTSAVINELRFHVDQWRNFSNPNDWKVTPDTQRLLQHWRHHKFSDVRPFFCQIEAVETAIWLTEVAPQLGKTGKRFLEHLADANNGANPELMRLALKLATGAGKTTVMAMIIAWQTINAVRQSGSSRFTRGFLVVTPGLTIRDRLRVLQPNDPDSYFKDRELVPSDMLGELDHAKIIITNYHAFKLRERVELSKGGRSLLQGRGDELNTLETEGQMIQRVMPSLMGLKNILVLNDEAHHCYRAKPEVDEISDLKGDDKEEAKKNNETARLWISGLEIVKRKLGITRVMDLSATPFFLRGSGYAEGTLFPWTMSDFSLMDAIECGIVKLPRVPVRECAHPPFEFAVVDEAQDISVPQLRFLAALGAGRPNSLFFAGDLGQRIFQQPFSWKALGVDVRGRSSTLRINYRTSHQIRTQADRLLGPDVSDVDGNREDRKGTISTFNGSQPDIMVLDTPKEELKAVSQWLAERTKEGIVPHEIGVFVRSAAELDRARAAVADAKLPYKVLDDNVETTSGRASISTMHLAKGLEFRTVVVMACDDEVIPSQERIETVADDADLEEVYNTERHLLYVACTRARDHLLVTGVEPASEFLDDLRR